MHFANVGPDGEADNEIVELRSICHLNLTHYSDTKLSMRRNIFAKMSI
jgi:hypothetical protein